jgi:hypothetical protein
MHFEHDPRQRDNEMSKNKKNEPRLFPTVVNSRVAKTYGLSMRFRKAVGGPEGKLIRQFLGSLCNYIRTNKETVVFVEPRIESGVPDVVVVKIKASALRLWNDAREKLDATDLRLLHFLSQLRPRSSGELGAIFKIGVEKSLVRLAEAGLIRQRKGRWATVSKSSGFAASEIFAIEAKINEWKRVRHQAELNTWFASRSIVLVSRIEQAAILRARLTGSGLGIWICNGKDSMYVAGRARSLPRSYVSWLFSELACKVLARGPMRRS